MFVLFAGEFSSHIFVPIDSMKSSLQKLKQKDLYCVYNIFGVVITESVKLSGRPYVVMYTLYKGPSWL